MIYGILKVLAMQEIVVQVHILISWGHALCPAVSTLGTCPTLIWSIADWICAIVVIVIMVKSWDSDIIAFPWNFSVLKQMFFMLVLEFILGASLSTRNKPIPVNSNASLLQVLYRAASNIQAACRWLLYCAIFYDFIYLWEIQCCVNISTFFFDFSFGSNHIISRSL